MRIVRPHLSLAPSPPVAHVAPAPAAAVSAAQPAAPRAVAAMSQRASWYLRLALHMLVASVPLLSISAHVLFSVSLRTVAVIVLVPLLSLLLVVAVGQRERSDRLLVAGFVWGLAACAAYDAFRLPTIYGAHLWGDFFGAVGGWATGTKSSYLVGYVWRYAGDGGGIAVVFFALAASIGLGQRSRRRVIAAAVAFAVCPVWAGLAITDLLAPAGHALFPLTATTLTLSLIGHLVYGLLLGVGYWRSRALEGVWPLRLPPARRDARGLI